MGGGNRYRSANQGYLPRKSSFVNPPRMHSPPPSEGKQRSAAERRSQTPRAATPAAEEETKSNGDDHDNANDAETDVEYDAREYLSWYYECLEDDDFSEDHLPLLAPSLSPMAEYERDGGRDWSSLSNASSVTLASYDEDEDIDTDSIVAWGNEEWLEWHPDEEEERRRKEMEEQRESLDHCFEELQGTMFQGNHQRVDEQRRLESTVTQLREKMASFNSVLGEHNSVLSELIKHCRAGQNEAKGMKESFAVDLQKIQEAVDGLLSFQGQMRGLGIQDTFDLVLVSLRFWEDQTNAANDELAALGQRVARLEEGKAKQETGASTHDSKSADLEKKVDQMLEGLRDAHVRSQVQQARIQELEDYLGTQRATEDSDYGAKVADLEQKIDVMHEVLQQDRKESGGHLEAQRAAQAGMQRQIESTARILKTAEASIMSNRDQAALNTLQVRAETGLQLGELKKQLQRANRRIDTLEDDNEMLKTTMQSVQEQVDELSEDIRKTKVERAQGAEMIKRLASSVDGLGIDAISEKFRSLEYTNSNIWHRITNSIEPTLGMLKEKFRKDLMNPAKNTEGPERIQTFVPETSTNQAPAYSIPKPSPYTYYKRYPF